jgi:hypothetical protein
MTKTDERRLDRVEGSLTPKQAFLLWLGEAQAHEAWAAHVLALKNQPIEQHPMQTLPRQVEAAVRESHRAENDAVTSARDRSAQKARRQHQIEDDVIRAVREVSF